MLKKEKWLTVVIILFGLSRIVDAKNANDLFRQVTFLLNVTKSLNSIYRFDNLILYRTPAFLTYAPIMETYKANNNSNELHTPVSDESIMYDEIIVRNFIIPSMVFTIAPWNYVNNTTYIPNLGNILTNQNLAIVILNDIFNKDLKEFVAISLGASLETKIVFLLIGDELTGVPGFIRTEKTRRFFRWCWSKNILNTILLYQKDNYEEYTDFEMEIYTYTPFPRPVQTVRLTDMDAHEFYTEKTFNIEGYEFKTPVLFDKPNVFIVRDKTTRRNLVTGTVGRLYMEFVDKIHGRFTRLHHESDLNYVKRGELLLDLLQTRTIDIGIHPVTCLLPFDGAVSYPVTHTSSCVVVPFVSEINRALYIPYTFNPLIWLLLLTLFLMLYALHCMENYVYKGQLKFVTAFLYTLRGMLNLPTTSTLRDNSLTQITFRITGFVLTITGLIFTQLHVATLTSLLSTSMHGRQLETVDDLRSANISIMVPDYQANLYQQLDIFPANFSDHLLITDPWKIAHHQNALNTSFGYILYKEEWKVLNNLQTNLGTPLFRVATQLCIPNVYFALPLQFNSPFYHRLQEFILWSHASGLETKWSDIVYSDLQHANGKLSIVGVRNHPVPITISHLAIAWAIWVAGVIVSATCFTLEMLRHGKSH